MTQPIPKILHQIWLGSPLPAKFAAWRERWIALHPAWDHRLYDDEAMWRLIDTRAPHLRPVFEAMDMPMLRADLLGYLAVYLDGGLYADLDMWPYMANDPLLVGADCVLSVEAHLGATYQRVQGYRQPWQLAACIFAAVPGHPFLGELIKRIASTATKPILTDDDVENRGGPPVLTRLFYEFPAERWGALRVLPQIHWVAPWFYPRIGPLARRIYARHASAGTWRFGARWTRKTIRNRLIARARWPNPFATAAGPLARPRANIQGISSNLATSSATQSNHVAG